MCCTTEPAELSKTILYASAANVAGKTVHVLGYQNQAKSRGPNAMILPFPAAEPLGPKNVLDTSNAKDILKMYAEYVTPRSRGRRREVSDSVQVFDSGRYTVVLATDASQIPAALQLVPENKRPALKPAIFASFADLYPGWPLAVCCFDGSVDSEPMLWWYVPQDPTMLFAPALDAHDGNPPVLGREVDVDHTVVFGHPSGWDFPLKDVDPQLKPYLAEKVVGGVYKGKMPNGDFFWPTDPAFKRGPFNPTRKAPLTSAQRADQLAQRVASRFHP